MATRPLVAADDYYDGIIIDDDKLPTDVEEFGSRLSHSLEVIFKEAMTRTWDLRMPET